MVTSDCSVRINQLILCPSSILVSGNGDRFVANQLCHNITFIARRGWTVFDIYPSWLINVGHALPVTYFFLLALKLGYCITSFRLQVFYGFFPLWYGFLFFLETDDFGLIKFLHIHGSCPVSALLSDWVVQFGTTSAHVQSTWSHAWSITYLVSWLLLLLLLLLRPNRHIASFVLHFKVWNLIKSNYNRPFSLYWLLFHQTNQLRLRIDR